MRKCENENQQTPRCVEYVGESPVTVLEKFCDTLSRPLGEQECHEPCPGHCVVSEWGGWTDCDKVCSEMWCISITYYSMVLLISVFLGFQKIQVTVNFEKAWQVRNQYCSLIKWLLYLCRTSLACPPLQEDMQCLQNQTCWTFRWQLTDWSSCTPFSDSLCGPGVQTRYVK